MSAKGIGLPRGGLKTCTGTCQWLADSFFNLALVFAQLGQPDNARNELDKMSRFANLDSNVYIYQVVWSPHYEDVVDGYLQTPALMQYAQELIKSQPDPNSFVPQLKKWCQQNKSK